MTLRLPPELAERLRRASFRRRETRTDICVQAITEHLDRTELGIVPGQEARDAG